MAKFKIDGYTWGLVNGYVIYSFRDNGVILL